MIGALYSSKSGAENYQHYLNAVANNISNVNTNGFKAQSVSFTDLVYTNIQGPDAAEQNLQAGSGSRILVSRDMTQGSAQSGSGSLNVMIDGDGFFAVQGSDGKIAYTRSGNFMLENINGTEYLLTNEGDFVLDSNLNRIEINGFDSAIKITAPSEADALNENSVTPGIFAFDNPEKLVALGSSKYGIAENTVINVSLDTESNLVQKMLESSNVDLVEEMSKMIAAQRGFQVNAQMIRTVDEMEQNANSLRN